MARPIPIEVEWQEVDVRRVERLKHSIGKNCSRCYVTLYDDVPWMKVTWHDGPREEDEFLCEECFEYIGEREEWH